MIPIVTTKVDSVTNQYISKNSFLLAVFPPHRTFHFLFYEILINYINKMRKSLMPSQLANSNLLPLTNQENNKSSVSRKSIGCGNGSARTSKENSDNDDDEMVIHRQPLFGFLSIPTSDINKQFVVPKGCKITKKRWCWFTPFIIHVFTTDYIHFYTSNILILSLLVLVNTHMHKFYT